MKSFIIKGDIIWSKSPAELKAVRDGYLVCEEGVSAGVYEYLPEKYAMLPMLDYHGKLVIPGMVDLHLHAPQYAFRGLGMDLELLDWLKTYTFPEEARYADPAYAEKAYSLFAARMKSSATTRAVIFATVHRDATVLLMDKMEETGLITYVGKVNMDRDAPDDLREPCAEQSAYDTFGWLNHIFGSYSRTKPILTPRFLPSCSETLLNELHEVQRAYDLPIQSHLSENPGEVELVKKLFPKTAFYADGYRQFGLFGSGEGEAKKTVMAHCVYCTPEETELIRKNGVFVAHCPASNMNLASGIAPIRDYMEKGIRVGLGSDIGAGESESIFRAIADAVQVSKLYWRMKDESKKPLRFEEAFWLATRGGGEFFGNVGGFDPGCELDALVLDDGDLFLPDGLDMIQRLQRDVYLGADRVRITAKFVAGRQIEL